LKELGAKSAAQQRLSLTRVQLVECAFQLFQLLPSFTELAFGRQALVVGKVFGGFRDEHVEIRRGLRRRTGCRRATHRLRLGEFANLGRTYSLKLSGGALWAGMQPLDEPPGAPGWLVKLGRKTGKILGYVEVSGKGGLHSVEVSATGEPITSLANHIEWFKAR
jgi:hypothetical protein